MMAVLTLGPKLCTVIGTRATGVGSALAGAGADTAGSAWRGPAALVVAPLAGAQDATSRPRRSHATRAIRIDGLVTERPTQRGPRGAGNTETCARHRPRTWLMLSARARGSQRTGGGRRPRGQGNGRRGARRAAAAAIE